MPPPDRSLLPSAYELERLSEFQTKAVMEAIDKENDRNYAYDKAGLYCGAFCFLFALCDFTYLVMNHFGAQAGVVSGTTVLAIITKIIRRRDSKL